MPGRLIVYFPIGDPAVPADLLALYAEAGVDLVECGWPAQNPHLDGPDVRASMARARAGDPAAAWMRLRGRLAQRAARLVVMTYAEPGHPGLAAPGFFEGVAALLAVGPPGGVRAALEARARVAGAAISAFLPLPLTPDSVAAAVSADGYVMLQAAPGLTGPRAGLDPANAARLAELRAAGIAAPIVLGFGVATGEQARAARALGADGVVVGSAALRAALEGPAALAALLTDLRRGLDG